MVKLNLIQINCKQMSLNLKLTQIDLFINRTERSVKKVTSWINLWEWCAKRMLKQLMKNRQYLNFSCKAIQVKLMADLNEMALIKGKKG